MFFFGWGFFGGVFNKSFTCVIETGLAPPIRDEGATGARLERDRSAAALARLPRHTHYLRAVFF